MLGRYTLSLFVVLASVPWAFGGNKSLFKSASSKWAIPMGQCVKFQTTGQDDQAKDIEVSRVKLYLLKDPHLKFAKNPDVYRLGVKHPIVLSQRVRGSEDVLYFGHIQRSSSLVNSMVWNVVVDNGVTFMHFSELRTGVEKLTSVTTGKGPGQRTESWKCDFKVD